MQGFGDFVPVDPIHDDHCFWPVFFQKSGLNVFLSDARNIIVLHMRVNIHNIFDQV